VVTESFGEIYARDPVPTALDELTERLGEPAPVR